MGDTAEEFDALEMGRRPEECTRAVSLLFDRVDGERSGCLVDELL